jgi:hypothetical protein
MSRHNPENERIKRAYRYHLQAGRGLSEASVDVATGAIHRFEESIGFRSFKKFHFEQAIAFRRKLDEATSIRDGKPRAAAGSRSRASAKLPGRTLASMREPYHLSPL